MIINPYYCSSIITLFEKIAEQAFIELDLIVTANDIAEYAFINGLIDRDEHIEPYDCLIEFDFLSNKSAIDIAEAFAPSLISTIERDATHYCKIIAYKPL